MDMSMFVIFIALVVGFVFLSAVAFLEGVRVGRGLKWKIKEKQ